MAIQFSGKKILEKISSVFGDEKSVLGLDIGTASIKVVQLREEKERAVLETYGELSTGAYQSSEEGRAVALQEDQVAEMIRDLLRESEAAARTAYVAMPLRYSFVTYIELPNMPLSELQSAVPFEARKYIPLPLNAVNLEWWPVRISEEERREHEGKIPILLAASQKNMADHYKRAVTKAGLSMKGSEIEVFSGTRSVISQFRTPVMVIDIGASTAKITIVDFGSIRSAYSIEGGSQGLTVTLSRALGVDFERAEEMKKESGIIDRPETAEMRKTILPFVDHILNESDRFRAYYRRKTRRSVDKVILLGGGAKLPGLVEYATEHFGVEVILGNPFRILEYPSFMQPIINKIAPSFGVAAGLALRALKHGGS